LLGDRLGRRSPASNLKIAGISDVGAGEATPFPDRP
jgi:hypothetical protein